MTRQPPESSHAMPDGSIVAYKAELRKAIRRNAHEPEINFLNITAMLDIMTIILVFLLKSLGESSAAIPQSDDLRLPTSIVTTRAASGRRRRSRSRSRRSWSAIRKILALPGPRIAGADRASARSTSAAVRTISTSCRSATCCMTRAAHGRGASQGEGPRSLDVGGDHHRRPTARPTACSSRCSSRSGRASSASIT